MPKEKNIDPLASPEDTTIFESVEGHIKAALAISKFSAASAYNRTKELERFADFCKGHGVIYPRDISKNHIIAYLGYLKIAAITKRTILSILTTYMDYLVDQELVLDNLAGIIEKPKAKAKDPDYLTEKEVDLIIQKEIESATAKFLDRNLLILNLLFGVCLRATEVSAIKLSDLRIDTDKPEVFLHRKGGKEKFIPLPEDIVPLFRAWLNVRGTYKNAGRVDWLFLTSHGTQMNRKQIYEIVNNAIKRAGLVKNKMGAHILRHSGATALSEAGATPQEVQFLMDHDKLSSTEIYLHINRSRLRDTVNRKSKNKPS